MSHNRIILSFFPASGCILSLCAATLLAVSCVENRLPDPVYVAQISDMQAEGAVAVTINQDTRTVTLQMDEVCDLATVNITSCKFNDDRVKSSVPLVGTFDLRKPVHVTLSTYQDYDWTLIGTQTIERYFIMNGQVGSSVIDETNCRVMVKLAKSKPRSWATVTGYKLGPREITSYSDDLTQIRDFSVVRTVDVSWRDVIQKWSIYVEQSDLAVDIRELSPRVTCCYAKVDVPDGAVNGMIYRQKDSLVWKQADSVVFSSGSMVAIMDSLTAGTSYQCRAYTGSDSTDVTEFVTLQPVQIPNAGLNCFSKCESDNYYSFFNPSSSETSLQTKWWDDGNVGSTTIGESYAITIPDTEDKMEGEAAARLVSRYVIVKFAAGNLFCGEFAGLIGTSGGMVNFGRPFTARPRALRLWLKYENGPIDQFNGAPSDDPVKEGDPDKGQVFIALGDWDSKTYGGTDESPVQVNTTKKSTFFDPAGPAVIAYGSFKTDTPTDGWKEIEIPLEYNDDFRLPTHIIISCASSYLGDWFTGSTQSRMWVDDFRLIY